MTARPMVPDTFVVPESFATADFRLELLGPQHNEGDHAAWMSSIEHIRGTPGFGHDREWPPAVGMTLAENLADLEDHAARSARRVDFAYTVIESATGAVIGCVYFKPSPVAAGQIDASSWVCAARAEMDGPLTDAVSAWLIEVWPFETVHYRAGEYPTVISVGEVGGD